MDLGLAAWGEMLRVFGHSEKHCRLKPAITTVVKSANHCHIGPVARGAGIKKGELGSVHLFKLVEAAGVRVFVRFANYDMPPYGRQPFPSGAGSAVTAAENKKGPLDIDSREGVASLSAIRGLRDTPTSCWRRRVLRPRD